MTFSIPSFTHSDTHPIAQLPPQMIAAGQAAEQPGSPDPFAAGLAAQSRGSGDVAGMPSQPGLLVDGTSYNVVQTALLLVRAAPLLSLPHIT